MKTLGYVLIGLGVILVASSFSMSVTVAGAGYEGIANNDLMNQRLMLTIAGTGSAICGFLALVIKAISITRT